MMKKSIGLVGLGIMGAILGCTTTDRVLFVTSSTIGINVDSKPPSASIAYDRIEGYIGPRYENGAVPPVVASIATGGTVFNPKIRQVYATGSASVLAVATPRAPSGPNELMGDPALKRLIFFGTTTTLGLKVGFNPTGSPDSLTLGYKRKEFSVIPLASTKNPNGLIEDIYPSVLASIDMTVAATSLAGTGLTNLQFFATGWPAESLARTPEIQGIFRSIASDALEASLTAEQRDQAKKDAAASRVSMNTHLDEIVDSVAPGGAVNATKLATLVDQANAKVANSVPAELKAKSTVQEIRDLLGDNQSAVQSLYDALNTSGSR